MNYLLAFIITCSLILICLLYNANARLNKKPKVAVPKDEVIELGKNTKGDMTYIILQINNIKYYLEIYYFNDRTKSPKIFIYNEEGSVQAENEFVIKCFKDLYKEKFEELANAEELRMQREKENKKKLFQQKFISYDEQNVKDILE